MIDEIDGALGEGKGAIEVILKMVIDTVSSISLLLYSCILPDMHSIVVLFLDKLIHLSIFFNNLDLFIAIICCCLVYALQLGISELK